MTEPERPDPMHREFLDVVESRFSRRGMLGGSVAAAAATFFGGGAALVGTATAAGAATGEPVAGTGLTVFDRLGFEAITASTLDEVRVPPGYTASVLLPWGTPLFSGVPELDVSNTAEDQAGQVGQGHDGLWFFPISETEGVLCVNMEYTITETLFADGTQNWDAAKTQKDKNAHGVTVARIRKTGATWELVPDAPENRRITASTEMAFRGPAHRHPLMKTRNHRSGAFTHGTFNNCGSGDTPWRTFLTCEENFNGFFRDLGEGSPTPEQRENLARYGVGPNGSLWAATDDDYRADLDPNRPNHYGWVVEIDPFDATSRPQKLTKLGRFKHEAAWVVVGDDGRVAVYMGDDERGEYVYKFVSDLPWETAIARGLHPFDRGRLHVATFEDDGTGQWRGLRHGEGGLNAANGFPDEATVLVKTRLAADHVGATRMDRPEWITSDPQTGAVYIACTNNRDRGAASNQPVGAANPRAGNPWGHIVRCFEDGDDIAAVTFTWDLFMVAGPGDGVDGSTIPSNAAFGSPDAVWMDGNRRLWIETDGSQPGGSNDQILCADPQSGQVKRFLTGPKDCEMTGATQTPDHTTMFVCVQHPGNGDPASSNWPDGGTSIPRPAVVAISKDDGGVIGT